MSRLSALSFRLGAAVACVADRAALLAGMADGFMGSGCAPLSLPDGCVAFTASLWPEPPAEPREVHFSATWLPSTTLVCLRPLAGYSLDGGLHRDPPWRCDPCPDASMCTETGACRMSPEFGRRFRLERLEYTERSGGWLSPGARRELETLRAEKRGC